MTTGQNATAAPRAYLFDEVFAFAPGANGERPIGDAAKMTAAVEAARQEGYAQGIEEGRRAATAEGAFQLAESAGRLVSSLKALSETAATDRRRIEDEAARLGMAAARKLAPALIDRQPGVELEALLRSCLSEMRDAPHLVIRLAADLAEDMRGQIEGACSETGFAGKIVVLGESDIAPGDGRIDWADGGIVRCRATIERALDEALRRYLAHHEAPPDQTEREDG